MAGHDQRDATTSPRKIPDLTAALNKDIKDLKIGVLYLDIKGLEVINLFMSSSSKFLKN